MREEIVKVYQIDELPKEQQEKICDVYRNTNVDFGDWFDYSQFIKRAEDEGFIIAEKNIAYDLYNQGEGASFSAKVDVLKFIKSIDPNNEKYPRTKEKYKEGDYEINIIRTDTRYSHEYTMSVDIRDNISEDSNDDLKDSLGAIAEGQSLVDSISELGELAIDRARGLAKELHKELRETYDYLTSDESVMDTLKANEYEFEMNSTKKR